MQWLDTHTPRRTQALAHGTFSSSECIYKYLFRIHFVANISTFVDTTKPLVCKYVSMCSHWGSLHPIDNSMRTTKHISCRQIRHKTTTKRRLVQVISGFTYLSYIQTYKHASKHISSREIQATFLRQLVFFSSLQTRVVQMKKPQQKQEQLKKNYDIKIISSVTLNSFRNSFYIFQRNSLKELYRQIQVPKCIITFLGLPLQQYKSEGTPK